MSKWFVVKERAMYVRELRNTLERSSMHVVESLVSRLSLCDLPISLITN